MAIAIDGQRFEDEWDYTMSQLQSPEPQKTEPPITEPTSQPYDPSKGPAVDYVQQPPERTTMGMLTGSDNQERYQLWPERMARDLFHAVHQTMNIAGGTAYVPHAYDEPTIMAESGEMIDPRQAFRENAKAVFEAGGLITFAPAPVVKKAVDGTLGSIAGVSAKTADTEMLKLAKSQEANGRATEKIWQDTGWYKGTDGQWKFEIPSQNAQLTDAFSTMFQSLKANEFKQESAQFGKTKLEEMLDFPELYKAYPELKGLEIQFDNTLKTAGAALRNVKTNEILAIVINPTQAGRLGYPPVKEVMLHEVQHYIQGKEKFDLGANPRSALEGSVEFLKKRWEEYSNKGDRESSIRMRDLINELLQNSDKYGKALYRRSPGEVEANLVQARIPWKDFERILESPKGTTTRGAEEGWLPTPLPMDPRRYIKQ